MTRESRSSAAIISCIMSSLANWLPHDSQDNEQETQLDAVLHVVLANWPSFDGPAWHLWMNPATICALLQTSSSCRRAVQRATIDCSAEFRITDMQKLAQFCAWLPKHAGLVDSFSLPGSWSYEPTALAANWPAAEQLITTALQQSAHVSNNPAMGTLGGTSSLNMHSFSIPYPTSPALLDALAAVGSLRYLSLLCASSQPTAAVCAALGRLRNLRGLHLENAEDSKGVVTTELAVAVQQLQQLNALSVEHDMHPDLLQHLPTGIQDLSLSSITVAPDAEQDVEPAAEPVRVDLQHVTRLTSLFLETSVPLSVDSLLPKELITLSAHGPCNFHPSSKLESLLVNAPQQSLGLMQFLPNLPQLQDLSVDMGWYYGDAEFAAVVAAVQRTTQVTALDWGFGSLWPWANLNAAEREAENAVIATDLGIGSVLAGLARLRKLVMFFPGIPESELSKFTALTALEELDLIISGTDLTDAVVVASRLRKLQRLSLMNSQLMRCTSLSHAVWPALGSLTALSSLDLSQGPVLRDQDLQHLSALTALGYLRVAGSLSDESKASFRAAMPQLTRLTLSNPHSDC